MKWYYRFLLSTLLTSSCGQDPAFNEQAAAPEGSAASGQDATAEGAPTATGTPGSISSSSSGAGVPFTPPAGYPPGTPKTSVLVEDGGSMSIPGVKATKVGINFEDYTDFDFNDSVLCFTGNLKIDGTKVVSYMKQSIQASVWNNSDCGHYIDVQIKNASGVVTQSFRYNDRTTTSATLNFDAGSELSVTMVSFANTVCVASVPQTNTARAKVLPNVCNR